MNKIPTDKFDSLLWHELIKVRREGNNKKKLAKIEIETLRISADEKNHDLVFNAALKSLQKTDPENATFERAEKLTRQMHAYAKSY